MEAEAEDEPDHEALETALGGRLSLDKTERTCAAMFGPVANCSGDGRGRGSSSCSGSASTSANRSGSSWLITRSY